MDYKQLHRFYAVASTHHKAILKRITEIEIAADEGEPVKLGWIDHQLALMEAANSSLFSKLGYLFDDLVDANQPEQHRVSVQLSKDEHVVVEQAAAAAGKTPDELIGDLIHERIQRAAHRIVKEGDDE